MEERRPLWAPWRMEYLESGGARDCIFCEPDPPVPDRERLILYRGRHVFALLNRYPYSVGHLMVAPYAHCASLGDLPPEVQAELVHLIGDAGGVIEKAYRSEGLNIGANLGRAGGAGFADHLHFHVVPRWSGDTNFMTVVAELRVIPKHLEQVYDDLAPRFAELSRA